MLFSFCASIFDKIGVLFSCPCTKNSINIQYDDDEYDDEYDAYGPRVNFRMKWSEDVKMEGKEAQVPAELVVEMLDVSMEDLEYYKNTVEHQKEIPRCGAPTGKTEKGPPCGNPPSCKIKRHVKWKRNKMLASNIPVLTEMKTDS